MKDVLLLRDGLLFPSLLVCVLLVIEELRSAPSAHVGCLSRSLIHTCYFVFAWCGYRIYCYYHHKDKLLQSQRYGRNDQMVTFNLYIYICLCTILVWPVKIDSFNCMYESSTPHSVPPLTAPPSSIIVHLSYA